MPTIWFLFWGTEYDKGEELPEQARALTGSYQLICVWLFLSIYSQPLTYHGPDSQHRKAPLKASCPSCSFRAVLAEESQSQPLQSIKTWPLRFPPACCSVLGFGRWIFSSRVCFHLLLSTPGNIAYFLSHVYSSTHLDEPAGFITMLNEVRRAVQHLVCVRGLQLLPQASLFFCLKNTKHSVSFYVLLNLHL